MKDHILWKSLQVKSLKLNNRFVMAPMTRGFSPKGIPTPDVAAYYKRRAMGQVGLILSEGTVVNRPSSSNNPSYPHFYGAKALAGWKQVIDEVHQAGGQMAPQLWHLGIVKPHDSWLPPQAFEGPSGLVNETEVGGVSMSESDIDLTISAFAQAALDAKNLGFDAVEIHGAHGYIIDQFFWSGMNQRTDRFGGPTIVERSQFAVEIIKRIRHAVGDDFAIILRLSQWKQQNYQAKIAGTPQEMESWLLPLSNAGVDIFHCSQRRYWEPEFVNSSLNFAGWAKKITGKTTITVGSVGLSGEFTQAFRGAGATPQSFENLLEAMDRGEFDLVAVGRALLADPYWVEKIHAGKTNDLIGFDKEHLKTLT